MGFQTFCYSSYTGQKLVLRRHQKTKQICNQRINISIAAVNPKIVGSKLGQNLITKRKIKTIMLHKGNKNLSGLLFPVVFVLPTARPHIYFLI